MKIYTVFDRVAEEAGPLFEAKNDAVAMRKFQQMLTENPTLCNPDHYGLFYIADFDHSIMSLEVEEKSPREIFKAETE